jgi:predicted nucleic acid-binding protein
VPRPIYFDTSIFIEMGTKGSKQRKHIRELLRGFQEDKVRVYTSIITVQEVSVAAYLKGSVARDTYGDVASIARVQAITKEIALTAAKNEAALKEIARAARGKRDPRKPLTEDEKLDQACENRRRKWDCFHLAAAQVLECEYVYSTDDKFQDRPKQLGLKDLKVIPPDEPIASIRGPLVTGVDAEKV